MSPLTIRLLGTIQFEVAGQDDPSWYQSKKLALFAYVLLSGGNVRRGELAAFLWPESDERRARKSLNQLVLEIRRDHGAEMILTRAGEDLAVDWSRVRCDASDLLAAAARGDDRTVVSLYSGPLMPGFCAHGAREFNDWLDRQRSTIALVASDALWNLAVSETTPQKTVMLLQRCFDLRPYDEAVLRRLMSALSGNNSKVQALDTYEKYRAMIKAEFGTSPDKASRDLARSIASAHADEPLPDLKHTGSVRDVVPARRGHRGTGSRHIATVLFMTAAAAIAYFLATGARASVDHTDYILVRDFTPRGSPPSALDFQFSEALATALAKDTSLFVTRSSTRDPPALDVSGTVSTSGNVYVGRVQLRNRSGRLVASADINSSMRLGIDTAAASIARLVSTRWYATHVKTGPDALLNRAAAHVRAAKNDLGKSSQSVSIELMAAEAVLDSIPRQARSYTWRSLHAQILVIRGRDQADIDPQRASEFFGQASALMRTEGSVAAMEQAAEYRSKQWSYDQTGNPAIMDSAYSELRQWLGAGAASAKLWFEFSNINFARGDYLGAYSAAVKSREIDPSRINNAGASLRIFLAAFNARNDNAAVAECDRIRHTFENSWPSAACTAFVVGWIGRQYDLRPLLADTYLHDPAAVVDLIAPRIRALVAAALARNADPQFVRTETGLTPDADLTACRALAVAAGGDIPRALLMRDSIAARPNGRRVLRMYARAFDDVTRIDRRKTLPR